jgi:neutral ceramidase
VGCNIEPFCEIGMAVKKESPFAVTCMSGYTNGRMAYLATAEEWPKGGYEVENSPFGQNAAEALTCEIVETLQALRARESL